MSFQRKACHVVCSSLRCFGLAHCCVIQWLPLKETRETDTNRTKKAFYVLQLPVACTKMAQQSHKEYHFIGMCSERGLKFEKKVLNPSVPRAVPMASVSDITHQFNDMTLLFIIVYRLVSAIYYRYKNPQSYFKAFSKFVISCLEKIFVF